MTDRPSRLFPRASALLLALALLPAACGTGATSGAVAPGAQPAPTAKATPAPVDAAGEPRSLDARGRLLRDDFDEDAGRVRLLVLASPT